MATTAMKVQLIIGAIDNASRVIAGFERNAITRLTNVRKAADRISKSSYAIGQQLGRAGLVAGAALAVPIKKAIEFEDQMTDVRKVVAGLDDKKAFQAMSKDILHLGRVLPMAHSELADLAAAGGRMGIARKDIITYSKDVGIMATAFDTAAGKIGEDMAKLSNVFGIPIKGIRQIGDAVNFLDDNTTAKGPEIIEVMRRAGGTAKQLGLQAPQVAALASTFLSLGSGVEVAGTASNALMRELALGNIQGEKFQKGIKQIGMSAKGVAAGMAIDPQKTILAVLDGINKLPKSKQVEVTTQLFGKEYGDDVAKLSQGIGEYRRQLALLNDPKLKGSMQREFAARSKTTANQVKLLKNNANELLITLGTGLLPVVNRVVAAIIPIAQRVTTWIEKNQKLANGIGMLVAGFATFSLVGSGLAFMVSGVASGVSILGKGFGVLFKVVGFAARAVLFLGRALLLNPIGLIITGIAVGAYLIIRNWTAVKGFFVRLWGGIKAITIMFWEGLKKVFLNYHPIGLIIKHWVVIKSFFANLWAGVKTTFFNAGKGLMDMLWKGIQAMVTKPIAAIKAMAKKIRDFLPFSPAKDGPLRDLHRVRIVETIAEGIAKPGPAIKAMRQSMGLVLEAGAKAISPTSGGGSSAGVSINFAPTVNVNGGGTDLKEQILAALKQYQGDFVKLIEEAQKRKQRTAFNY